MDEMRASKYVQSDLSDTFKEVKAHLEAGEYCLFVGTPCQVHGMASFIGNSVLKERLLLVDLLCLGVSSPMLYEKWVRYIETKYKDNVKRVNFRDKSYGYATANVRIELKRGGYRTEA